MKRFNLFSKVAVTFLVSSVVGSLIANDSAQFKITGIYTNTEKIIQIEDLIEPVVITFSKVIDSVLGHKVFFDDLHVEKITSKDDSKNIFFLKVDENLTNVDSLKFYLNSCCKKTRG